MYLYTFYIETWSYCLVNHHAIQPTASLLDPILGFSQTKGSSPFFNDKSTYLFLFSLRPVGPLNSGIVLYSKSNQLSASTSNSRYTLKKPSPPNYHLFMRQAFMISWKGLEWQCRFLAEWSHCRHTIDAD